MASWRITTLCVALVAVLGCSEQVVIGTLDSAGGSPTTGTIVGTCVNVPVSCTYGDVDCTCTGTCPSLTVEVRCTSPDVGPWQCACLVNGSAAGSCAAAYGTCDLNAGCCTRFFPRD
jgi:hypothetical protein